VGFSAFDHSHQRHTLSPTFGDVSKHRVGNAGTAVVKGKRATLVGWILHNSGYRVATITFYDQAHRPSAEDAEDWHLVIGPGQTSAVEFAMQIPCFNGLAYVVDGDVAGLLLYS
jgi:hypothetical protein